MADLEQTDTRDQNGKTREPGLVLVESQKGLVRREGRECREREVREVGDSLDDKDSLLDNNLLHDERTPSAVNQTLSSKGNSNKQTNKQTT